MADGRLNKCIECTLLDVKRHRQENLERVRAYDSFRAGAPHRVAARKEYASTPAGRAAHAKSLKASAQRYPDRAAARTKLGNAVRRGKVIPWPVCAVPDCDGAPEGHHPDYSRPLDVVWLCNRHHRAAHATTLELESA